MLPRFTAEEIRTSRAWLDQRHAVRRAAREKLRHQRLAAARRAIAELMAEEPALRAVWLFGSILQPGRFHSRSDVDVAVDCDDPHAESRFWRALEERLGSPCDVRPRKGPVARAVEQEGERIRPRGEARKAEAG
jgi:predicted nucleotidyltransferase